MVDGKNLLRRLFQHSTFFIPFSGGVFATESSGDHTYSRNPGEGGGEKFKVQKFKVGSGRRLPKSLTEDF